MYIIVIFLNYSHIISVSKNMKKSNLSLLIFQCGCKSVTALYNFIPNCGREPGNRSKILNCYHSGLNDFISSLGEIWSTQHYSQQLRSQFTNSFKKEAMEDCKLSHLSVISRQLDTSDPLLLDCIRKAA